MKSHILALAALAAISGTAYAGEATQPKAKGPVTMSNSELDMVYAGALLGRTVNVTTYSLSGTVEHNLRQDSSFQNTGTHSNCVTNPSGRVC